jgi:trypsin
MRHGPTTRLTTLALLLVTLLQDRATAAEAVPELPGEIVNGVTTQDQPTTGALLFAGGQICSGTLIGCHTFLTAAHCVCDNGSFASCGTPDPADYEVYLQHGGLFGVTAIDVDPSYVFGVAGDIAVITLDDDVAGVPPTPINTTGSPVFGTAGTIAGFGLTEGGGADAGLLREGSVETASCAGSVPQPAHLCWAFTAPIGPIGTDSNTCSGDSGGPLFIDFGGGAVVAGVTSGGDNGACLAPDLSFDANVYESRAFIQSIGGADLSNTTCGATSQVGDPDTVIETHEAHPLSASAQACRREVTRHYTRYAPKAQKAMQRCTDRLVAGTGVGPCPDVATAITLQKAVEKVDAAKIAKKCPTSAIHAIMAAGACSGASDAASLAACIVTASDAAVTAALDVEYADPAPAAPLPAAEASCQEDVGRALYSYTRRALSVMAGCQNDLDKGDVQSCPDLKTSAKIASFAVRVAPTLARSCDDGLVASLDAAGTFGGTCAGATTVAGLATCQIAEHDAIVAGLVGILEDPFRMDTATFEVEPGTARLRVTLNGIDELPNDLDLYAKLGAPATTFDFDARSINAGVFESIEIDSPTAGTWHVLVDTFAGDEVPFQLTITALMP